MGPTAPLLIDVTPHTLGIETVGGYADPVVERNSSIPLRSNRTFATSADNQTQVRINILEGESRVAQENRLTAALLRPAPGTQRDDQRRRHLRDQHGRHAASGRA